ncbi:MAG: hypothetical protein U0941_19415 [Planctomycetaceae bacterium]
MKFKFLRFLDQIRAKPVLQGSGAFTIVPPQISPTSRNQINRGQPALRLGPCRKLPLSQELRHYAHVFQNHFRPHPNRPFYELSGDDSAAFWMPRHQWLGHE